MGDMERLIRNLDRGFYREVDAQRSREGGLTSFGYFARMAEECGIAPDDAERERRERAFCKRFGIADPYGAYADRVRAFARETWALERALAELGLNVKGPSADALGKFFSTSASTILFPAYVETQVVAGLLLTSLVPAAVAQEVLVNSHTAEHIALADTEADRRTSRTGEGARATTVTLRTADRSVTLQKYQAQLCASYEALRLQRLNVVGLFLQRLGAQMGIDETDELIEVALAGDGNPNSAAVPIVAETPGTLDYDELIRLSLAFPKGYEFRMAIVNDANLRALLNLEEFKNPLSGFNYQATGRIPGPFGAEWHRWTSTGSDAFGADRILALDNRLALVQYTEQGVMTESDRLIDRQFEQTVVSKWTGFAKLDYHATQCLDLEP